MTEPEPPADEGEPGGAGAPPLLEGLSLAKYFPQRARSFGPAALVRAVEEASLAIAPGETVGLLGESGAGKSVLARLLLRLVEPSFGRLSFEGRDITLLPERDLRPLRRRMQLLFQDARAALDERLTVEQIVAEPLRIHDLVERGGREGERVAALLRRVGLSPALAPWRPPELGEAEIRRVSIARALALEPRLLVCDDPLARLSPSEQPGVLELLESEKAARAHAMLLISRDPRLVLGASQRVLVMYAGRIVEAAASEALRNDARHPYTRALLHALPEPDPGRRRLRLLLDEPPAPRQQAFAGCAFQPRCPRARAICDTDAPPFAPLPDERRHEVACWYPHE